MDIVSVASVRLNIKRVLQTKNVKLLGEKIGDIFDHSGFPKTGHPLCPKGYRWGRRIRVYDWHGICTIATDTLETTMKLLKILFKNGHENTYIVEDDQAEFVKNSKLWEWSWIKVKHAAGFVRVCVTDISSINVLDKKIVVNTRETNTPAGRIRVRRITNPMEFEEHYEDPCN